MWPGRATLTVTDCTPSAAWPASGTTSAWCMSGWRVAGGPWTRGEVRRQKIQCPKLKRDIVRYIYWNAHFFGENFYGWSIGDKQSLSESGPFHSQGRIGAGTQPWQGSWRGESWVTCSVMMTRDTWHVMQVMSVWSWSPVTRVWPPSGTLATSATWGAPAGSLAEAGSGEAWGRSGSVMSHAMLFAGSIPRTWRSFRFCGSGNKK